MNRYDKTDNLNSYRRISIAGLWAIILVAFSTGCSTVGESLNPFYEDPAPEALLGEKNDNALRGDTNADGSARKALEAMATYRRAQLPEPNYPVVQPAVVRLMWIPDHLNKSGDLVPAHYYYLKVLKDRWAVTDAFELESQLSPAGSSGANLPYIMSDEARESRMP